MDQNRERRSKMRFSDVVRTTKNIIEQMRPTRRGQCLMCNAKVKLAKDGGNYLWCGRVNPVTREYICDYVCSETCFLRALVKFAPMVETRRGAEARLLELNKQ